MASNSFGRVFRLTSFGESHGAAMGVVVDGCPSNLKFDHSLLQKNLKRRRPGKHSKQENLQSDREEKDLPQVLSGVFEDRTLGTPIAILANNIDQRSKDYDGIKTKARPGHADDTWKEKFGHVDHRGGGRSSARETISRVMAGSVAQMLMNELSPQTSVYCYVSQIYDQKISQESFDEVKESNLSTSEFQDLIDESSVRSPDSNFTQSSEDLLRKAKEEGKSYGGYIEVRIKNPPKSLGKAVFQKLKSEFSSAMLSIGAANSFEMGNSALLNQSEGSSVHKSEDPDGSIYGGVRGGFSTGEDIFFRVGFKPTSSVLSVAVKGRHDPCILPRAIPVVESMAYLVLADQILLRRLDTI